jgi:hypothetical protein
MPDGRPRRQIASADGLVGLAGTTVLIYGARHREAYPHAFHPTRRELRSTPSMGFFGDSEIMVKIT